MNLQEAAAEALHNIESLYGEGCCEPLDATAILLMKDDGEHWPGWHFEWVATPSHPDELWPLNGFYRNDGVGNSRPEMIIPLRSVEND